MANVLTYKQGAMGLKKGLPDDSENLGPSSWKSPEDQVRSSQMWERKMDILDSRISMSKNAGVHLGHSSESL